MMSACWGIADIIETAGQVAEAPEAADDSAASFQG